MLATPVVEIAFTTDPGSVPVWVDVTSRLRGFSTNRGRQHELDRYQAGTGSVLLSNRDRALDPTYVAGAYYPNVRPMRRTRLSMLFPAGYAQTVKNDSPFLYWRLGESVGPSAADASGNGRTGTYTNGPTLAQAGGIAAEVDGTSDTAVLFARASNQYVVSAASLGIGAAAPWTFECWFKLTALPSSTGSWNDLISTQTAKAMMGVTTGDRLMVGQNGGGGVTVTGPSVSAGTWYHAVGTYDGSNLRLYLNGSLVAGPTAWAGFGGTHGVIAAACDINFGEYFGGVVDEVAIYPTALSAARVLAHYNAGRDQANSDNATYRVMTGFTDGYPQTWPGYVDAVVTVPFTDAFKVLALATVGGTFPQQNTGTRVGALLDDAGWPAADRDVDTGQSDIQEVLLAQSTALANLQTTEQTENGRLFVTKDGLVRFDDRHTPILPPADESLALFGDGGGDELPYADLRLSFDDTNVWNEIRVGRDGGTTQVAEDATSQGRYFRRTLRVDTLITTDAEAADAANWLLNRYAEPALRADELVVKPMSDDRLWPVVLGLELGDRITVRKRPPGGGDAIERDVIIEGIKWIYDLDSFVWSARVSPADVEANWAVWGTAVWDTSKWAY